MKYTFIRVFTLAKKKAKEYTRVTVKKYNPYHGADGKFTTASGAGGSAAGGEAQTSGASQTKETSQASGGNVTSETTQIAGTKEEGKASGKDDSNKEKPKKVSATRKGAEKLTATLNGIKTTDGRTIEAEVGQMHHTAAKHQQTQKKWFRDLIKNELPKTEEIISCEDKDGKKGIAYILRGEERRGVVITEVNKPKTKTSMSFKNEKELNNWIDTQNERIKGDKKDG